MRRKKLLLPIIIILVLLAIPLIAMQFTESVDWSLLDFVVMGALLIGLWMSSILVSKKVKRKQTRPWLLVLVTLVFVMIWIEITVGII